LKDGARSLSAARPAERLRNVLVVAEIALAVVLLVGAGLFIGSFMKVMRVDIGYVSDSVLTAGLFVRPGSISAGSGWQGLSDAVDRVNRLPGVESATVMSGTDLFRYSINSSTRALPNRPGERMTLFFSGVTPGFQRTLQVPLRRGRFFEDADIASGKPVVVISESVARHFFPDQDPVDRVFDGARVVGVVSDVRFGVEGETPARVYVPLGKTVFRQNPSGVLLVRTSGNPVAILPAVRTAVQAVLPDVPLSDVRPLDDRLRALTAYRRVSMVLLGLFGVLGLVIAAVGVYGVMTYAVTQRTREIGVRVALGATRSRVVGELLGQGALLAGTGLAIGMGGAWFLSRMAEPFLFQVEPTDVRVFATAALVLAISALAATAIPARWAASVDPLIVLKAE
jgi:predicted permease